MELIKTKFKGLVIYKKNTYKDKRGYFRELFLNRQVQEKFPFDAMSYSKKYVLRGLHLQLKNTQSKYVNVLKGKIFDVCVDCRKKSKTFGKYFQIILSEKNCKSIYIPPGFAHGFRTLHKENIVVYSCTEYRDQKSESGILWNDQSLKINWKIKKPIISTKDKINKSFNFFFK